MDPPLRRQDAAAVKVCHMNDTSSVRGRTSRVIRGYDDGRVDVVTHYTWQSRFTHSKKKRWVKKGTEPQLTFLLQLSGLFCTKRHHFLGLLCAERLTFGKLGQIDPNWVIGVKNCGSFLTQQLLEWKNSNHVHSFTPHVCPFVFVHSHCS